MENTTKGLMNILKPKESKYALEGSTLKIGKGVIICGRNSEIIIPLDAISYIKTFEQGKKGYEQWPLAIFAGVILLLIPVSFIRIAGVLTILVALVNIVLIFQQNQQTVYELMIQNHAGRFFYIETTDVDFLEEIRAALLACIDDKSVAYSGKDRLLMIDGDVVMGDKIAKFGDFNISGGQNTMSFGEGDALSGGVKNTADNGSIIGNENTITNSVLDDEWDILKEFALKRRKDFADGERNYKICTYLYVYAKEKDDSGCRSLMKKAGKAAIDIILASAPMAVKTIIEKFM